MKLTDKYELNEEEIIIIKGIIKGLEIYIKNKMTLEETIKSLELAIAESTKGKNK